jgi:hypothetical protein
MRGQNLWRHTRQYTATVCINHYATPTVTACTKRISPGEVFIPRGFSVPPLPPPDTGVGRPRPLTLFGGLLAPTMSPTTTLSSLFVPLILDRQ